MYDEDENETNKTPKRYLLRPVNTLPCRVDETHDGYIGHYTGRCGKCGSSNLWDDNLSYGCNECGRMWIGG